MQTLNKLSVSCLMFLIPFRIFCQFDVWTTPAPISDSLTDNRNAIVAELEFYGGDDIYVFWEKSSDTNSTAIYCRRYYAADDPVALVTAEGFHLINPCILKNANVSYPPSDTTFYFFYLSDQDGDFDIYYKKYANGNFTEAVALTDTPGDEKQLRSSGYHGLTWEYEGKIIYNQLDQTNGEPFSFLGEIVVDSGNCSNPAMEPRPEYMDGAESYIAWEKVVGDSTRIMISGWDWDSGYGWIAPETIDSTGHNTHPRFEESTFQEVGPTLCWDNLDFAGERRVFCTNPTDIPFNYFVLQMVQDQEYFPAIFNIFMGASWLWDYAVLTYIKDENGQSEVYVPTYPYLSSSPDQYFNLSNSPGNETNPSLWNGYYFGEYQDVINIWESRRNGHWQLFTSKVLVQIYGGVDDRNQKGQDLMRVSPNPFTDRFTINFKSEITSKASIVLYDHLGRQVGNLLEPDMQIGDQSWVIEPEKITGHELPPGIYFVRLQAEGMDYSAKLVKSGE
jgi:hypothetical protein